MLKDPGSNPAPDMHFYNSSSLLPYTVKLQYNGPGPSAVIGPLYWSCPLYLDKLYLLLNQYSILLYYYGTGMMFIVYNYI